MDRIERMRELRQAACLSLLDGIAAGSRTGTQVVASMTLLPPWSADGPQGDGEHPQGEACLHEGQPWRCCQAHNSRNNPDVVPGKAPAQWAQYHTTEPERALPFVHPTGAHDVYQKGECMIWTDGTVWRSAVDNNAYSPEEYPQNWEKSE